MTMLAILGSIVGAVLGVAAVAAQVRNAPALHDQALEEFQVGTSPRIDATRTEVQLHTEEYNLSVARNNFAIAQLTLARLDFDRIHGQTFNAEGLLKPGLSVEPDVRVR